MLLTALALPANGQVLEDITQTLGVDILANSDIFGSGLSFYDVDGDGLDDLTFSVQNDSLHVFINTGTNADWIKHPLGIHLAGETKHIMWVDFDNDGDADLFITAYGHRPRLFENVGSLTFVDVTSQAGLPTTNALASGACWGDFDRDGHLDVHIAMHEFEGTALIVSGSNLLFRNNGDGTFSDVTGTAGVGNGIKPSLQSVWTDINKDGWPDLYVINDRVWSNGLYLNNGNGTFTDITFQSGSDAEGQNIMTATVGDPDNDGGLDIYMTNTGGNMPSMMLRNNGDNTFEDVASLWNLATDGWGWGAVWVDLDNDMWQDLYVTIGTPDYAAPFGGMADPNFIYTSNTGPPFTDTSDQHPQPNEARSFAVCKGDINGDGYYDLAVQNQAPDLPYVLLNHTAGGHHVKLSLRGTVSNRDAIGSWITVHAGGLSQQHYTQCGESYLGQSSQHIIFGCGAHTMLDSIEVLFPSGHRDVIQDVAVDQHILFTEGMTYTASITPSGVQQLCQPATVLLDAGEHAELLWNTGATTRTIEVSASGAYWFIAVNSFGIQAWSDTVVVVVQAAPTVIANSTSPSCFGANDGALTLVDLSLEPPLLVLWSNGSKGAQLSDIGSGTYTYTYTDAFGCTSSGSAVLEDPDVLFVQVFTEPAWSGNDGTLDLLIFGGQPPYSTLLDGVPFTPPAEGLMAGSYTVLVNDANLCSWQDVVDIAGTVSSRGNTAPAPSVAPNPVKDILRISSPWQRTHVAIWSSDGRILLQQELQDHGWLDIRSIPPGSHVIALSNGIDEHHTMKLVVLPD